MSNLKDKIILVIVAHADDMEFFAGGTVAKMVKNGAKVYQVITTNNEKGSFFLDKETLIKQSRENEAVVSAKFLGLQEVIFLEYPDGELLSYPFNEIREKFMKIIRKIKPDILMTWDPFAPYETHQDHRVVGMAATEAGEFAHMPSFFPEHIKEGATPHFVKEYLFFAKNPREFNKAVDISETIDLKVKSLLLHKSQMELTISDIKMSLEAVGINIEEVGFPKDLKEESYAPFVDLAIKGLAAQVGAQYNLPLAEEFRHTGFGMAKWIYGDMLKEKEIDI